MKHIANISSGFQQQISCAVSAKYYYIQGTPHLRRAVVQFSVSIGNFVVVSNLIFPEASRNSKAENSDQKHVASNDFHYTTIS